MPEPAPQAASEAESASKEKTARDYARHLDLGDEAKALLEGRQPPGEYLDALIAHELFAAALKFLAFWLPKPAAVAWGCQCLEAFAGDRLPPREKEAFVRARKWSAEPNEKNRRTAEAAAEKANYDGPASFLAAAAFWSGGSIARRGPCRSSARRIINGSGRFRRVLRWPVRGASQLKLPTAIGVSCKRKETGRKPAHKP